MRAVLVFLDGTICDTRCRPGSAGPVTGADVLADRPVPGSAAALRALAEHYALVYLGARPPETLAATHAWLAQHGYPAGVVDAAEDQAGRLAIVRRMASQFTFIAGIGDRFDDNALHRELGCTSLIVQEYAGDWAGVPDAVRAAHRRQKARENALHLAGKIEGLARVLPVLEQAHGPALWDGWLETLEAQAAASAQERRAEELALFARWGLNSGDLRDAARLDELLREADWEDDPVYGLQDAETVEASASRWALRITRCAYAELWQQHGRPDIGFRVHCATDRVWWDRPAWNPEVRFEQSQTLMQGAACCLFCQFLPEE